MKTKKSRRIIYMPEFVFDLVVAQKKKQIDLKRKYGLSYNPNNLFVNNNLKFISLHQLRHSYASMCILNNSNISIKVVSEMLGHSNISITADTYMHVLDAKKKEAANSIDKLISNIVEKI